MSDHEFVKSQRGRNLLHKEGYIYVRDRITADTIYWKCEQYKSGCKGRVIEKGPLVKTKGSHDHACTPEKLETRKVLQAIRQKSRTSVEPPQAIISEATASTSEVTRTHLPSISSMKRTIRNIRIKENDFPSVPISRNELVLPEKFKLTPKGEKFLLFDSGADDDDEEEPRFLMFGTEENLRLLSISQYWFADGTFKTVPHFFHQLYTVHGKVGEIVVPLIYILLPNKQRVTYVRSLRHLKECILSFGNVSLRKIVMTDFEVSLISVVKEVFPDAKHYGCFFHFKQCLYRKISNLGLKKKYDSDPEFQRKVKLLEALAFVPVNFVERSFNIILEQNILPVQMQNFVDYFEDTWIGKFERRTRNPPMFPYTMWSCYSNIIHEMPVTNNIVEGWNRGFLSQMRSEKPSVWSFLDSIQREQTTTELKITRERTGERMLKKKYKNLNTRLQNVCSEFDELYSDDEIEQYLRRISLII